MFSLLIMRNAILEIHNYIIINLHNSQSISVQAMEFLQVIVVPEAFFFKALTDLTEKTRRKKFKFQLLRLVHLEYYS